MVFLLTKPIKPPCFLRFWPRIKHHIEGNLIVCHNSSFDVTKLIETLAHYQLEIPEFEVDCTYKIFGGGLEDCCKKKWN
jgi:DNA polymerase-3 subunit epsilon